MFLLFNETGLTISASSLYAACFPSSVSGNIAKVVLLKLLYPYFLTAR